ncbi:MAG: AMP-binding protein [Robiginitalea sp.]
MMKEYFNKAFHINGLQIAYEDLSEVAYSLVKEGEAFEREIGDFMLDWISESSEIVQKTSGSTGVPREISMSKAAMVSSARATGEYFGLKEGTKALLCLPAANIAGKMMLVRAMVLGWKLDLAAPSGQPLEFLDHEIDFTAMVPLQLYQSLEKLDRVGTILVGGAPLSSALRARIPEKGTAIYESYGMTETASHIALRKLAPVPETEDPVKALPPFQALPGITLEQDDRGCLVIHAAYLSPEPIVTNDLIVLEKPDQFRWLGRADHIVNSGGIKLIPEQLEARLEPLLDAPFFLTGVPDVSLGEKLVLIMEGEAREDLLESLKGTSGLDSYEVPREVYWLPEFTMTKTGKINRPETLNTLF